MNIGSIIWPTNAKAACHHYLDFVIRVVEKLDIVFPETRPDPLEIARRYVAAKISDDEYKRAAATWWSYLDSVGELRGSRDKTVLTSRLAICLLSATSEEVPRLGDNLSWFFEIIGFMGIDTSEPIAMMANHFASSMAEK